MNCRSFGLFALVLVVLLASGCSSSAPTFQNVYPYVPQPAMATVFSSKEQKPAVNSMVSVMGIHRADQFAPLSMEVRMRLENRGVVTATFDPRSMELTSGSLETLEPPLVRPPQPVQIPPGQTASLTAYFPFPPGADLRTMGLESLRLRWDVQLDNETVQQTVDFRRVSPQSYDAR